MGNHYGAIQTEGDITYVSQSRRKEGNVFLGCCDMRRAVIIVDAITLVLLVIQMLLYIDVMRTEQISEEMEDAARSLLRTCVVEALLCLISLWGALSFSMGMVFAGVVNFGVGVAAGFALMIWPGILCNLIFLAPHVLLFIEIQRGIMTEATYQNEEYSCCCV